MITKLFFLFSLVAGTLTAHAQIADDPDAGTEEDVNKMKDQMSMGTVFAIYVHGMGGFSTLDTRDGAPVGFGLSLGSRFHPNFSAGLLGMSLPSSETALKDDKRTSLVGLEGKYHFYEVFRKWQRLNELTVGLRMGSQHFDNHASFAGGITAGYEMYLVRRLLLTTELGYTLAPHASGGKSFTALVGLRFQFGNGFEKAPERKPWIEPKPPRPAPETLKAP